MSDLNPDLIELHAKAICNATGGPQWDQLQSTRQAGIMRAEARAALAVVAPLIAAQALRDAAYYGPMHFAATHRDQWSRGRLLVTQAWLRARADQIEAGR